MRDPERAEGEAEESNELRWRLVNHFHVNNRNRHCVPGWENQLNEREQSQSEETVA